MIKLSRLSIRSLHSVSKLHSNRISKLWEAYSRSLESKPLPTKALTASLIAFTGDIASQVLLSEKDIDISRILRYTLLGGVLVGPTLHFWYFFFKFIILTKIINLIHNLLRYSFLSRKIPGFKAKDNYSLFLLFKLL